MENMTADHPMIKVLKRFRNGQRTDVAKGTMTNSDFIALCLYAFGPFGGPELRRLCGLWRGERYVCCGAPGEKKLDDRVLDSYFIPHYGYTATDFFGRKAYTGLAGKRDRKRRYWYRKVEHARAGVDGPRMRRYQNALTMAGILRAEELMLLLSGHTKA
jgi:hypothetical protein